jgi:S1-C subfamily serine protease
MTDDVESFPPTDRLTAPGPWTPPDQAGSWQAPAERAPWSPPAPGPTEPSVAPSPWSAPGSAEHGWQSQPASPAGGWPPPPPPAWSPPPRDPWGQAPGAPWSPPPRRRTRAAGVAAIIVAMLVAALFGVGVGRAINGTRTITTASSPVESSQPAGSLPATGAGNAAGPLSAASVAAVERGVVDINTKLGYQSATAAGTGMILTAGGEILTNNHVIDGATAITATVVATGRSYTAKVVGTDVTADVAVLQLQGASGLTTIPLGDSSSVAPGDAVVALGNAGGIGGAPSVVTGTVQATGQAITASDQGGANAERLTDLLETDAPIQPGDSGGPLVNASGKVIGMDTAASTGSRFQVAANTAFAIPINDAMAIVHQIEAGKASATIHLGLPGFLGVEVQGANAQGGGSSTSGAVISAVVAGSPAAHAGLQAGDVITAVDGHRISVASDLTTQLRSHQPNDRVSVTWTDQAGTSHTATVTLMTGPAN